MRKDDTETTGKIEAKTRLIELKAKGRSCRRIAGELNVSKSTVANWVQELEAEIASARAIELEALQEEYGLSKEARIRSLGKLLNRLEGELEKRDFKKLTTEKLLNMMMKYQEKLTAEFEDKDPLSENQITLLKGKSGVKLDAENIAIEVGRVWQRFRLGQIDESGFKAELTACTVLLRAHDQVVLQTKIEQIESVLGKRR